MRSIGSVALAALLALAALHPGATAAAELSDYSIRQLLEPCMEGDADSRWGAYAEAECEQYISGFVDAYVLLQEGAQAGKICLPPPGNRADELRWAFMKWAHDNFDRREEPAAHGLLAVVQTKFKCR